MNNHTFAKRIFLITHDKLLKFCVERKSKEILLAKEEIDLQRDQDKQVSKHITVSSTQTFHHCTLLTSKYFNFRQQFVYLLHLGLQKIVLYAQTNTSVFN